MTDADVLDDVDESPSEKTRLNEMLEGASPERLKSIELLLGMPDEKAAKYGEALSLLELANCDTTALRVAIRRVQSESGPELIKLRTPTRIFKFMKDEDNPDEGFYHRGFHVKSIDAEQRSAISISASKRLSFFSKNKIKTGNLTEEDVMQSITALFDSEDFAEFLTETDSIYRKIVVKNIVEVEVGDDGVVKKPLKLVAKALGDILYDTDLIPQSILNKLEEDLRLLVDEQDLMGKNSQMADILGS